SHAFAFRSAFELVQITLVGGLIHEELVDQFNRMDAMVTLRNHGEIEMIHFLPENGVVIGPFGEADFEKRRLRAPTGRFTAAECGCACCGAEQNSSFEEGPSIHACSHGQSKF